MPLAGGLLREASQLALPAKVREAALYRATAGMALRFLIEQVGEVDGIYSRRDPLARWFVYRYATGGSIEIASIAVLYLSPVWVLAALGDASTHPALTVNMPPPARLLAVYAERPDSGGRPSAGEPLRILKATLPSDMAPAHLKNYLYRIASNLVHDHRNPEGWKSCRNTCRTIPRGPDGRFRRDCPQCREGIRRLKPGSEKSCGWLMSSASTQRNRRILRSRTVSIRPIPARARARFGDLLRRRGLGTKNE